MGFRSTFTTSCYSIEWPDWFREKYKGLVHFPPDKIGAISAVYEAKMYMSWIDLADDIQKSLVGYGFFGRSGLEFMVMFFHECDGCTRCHITEKYIKWSEPGSWEWVDRNTHDYCYGCSKPEEY